MSLISSLYNDLNVFYSTNHRRYSISNPLFTMSGDQKTLTWYNYSSKGKFYTYDEYYDWVSNNLQYSLAIDDRALLQIYFHERGDKIVQASLSFLPRPDLLMSYFRFDMDTLNCSNYYHNSFHANFGYRSDDVRFSLQRFPHPSEFLRFILFILGHVEFSTFNRTRFFNDLTAFGEMYSHHFDFKTI